MTEADETGYEIWLCHVCRHVQGEADPDHEHGPLVHGYWVAAAVRPGEITLAEFRAQGYLQEVNRLILHPLGLALVVETLEGFELIRGVRDERVDPEGIIFAPGTLTEAERERGYRIETENDHRAGPRLTRLGYVVQPLEAT